MSTETKFVDVIIPLSIPYLYTYRVPRELTNEVIVGQRVVVQFGRGRKLYSALIKKIHNQPPKAYEAKYIDSILDDQPLVNQKQLKHWDWIADYYLSNLGEVYSAALPGALKLASETKIVLNADFEGDYLEDLTDKEYQVYEALSIRNVLSLSEIAELLFIKNT